MARELPKTYDPKVVEDQIYQTWLDHDCFRAEPDPEKTPPSSPSSCRRRTSPASSTWARPGRHPPGHSDPL